MLNSGKTLPFCLEILCAYEKNTIDLINFYTTCCLGIQAQFCLSEYFKTMQGNVVQLAPSSTRSCTKHLCSYQEIPSLFHGFLSPPKHSPKL